MSRITTTTRTFIVIGSVLLLHTAACKEDPGEPVGPNGAAGTAPTSAGSGGATPPATTGGRSGGSAGGAAGGSAGRAAGTAGGAAGAAGGAAGGSAGSAGNSAGGAGGSTGGAGGAAGSAGGAGGATGAAGAAGAAAPGPCPSGWTCQGLAAMEITAKDKDGKSIEYGCGKGGLIECTDATVATDCPELPQAICAHLDDFGVLSCSQRCTP